MSELEPDEQTQEAVTPAAPDPAAETSEPPAAEAQADGASEDVAQEAAAEPQAVEAEVEPEGQAAADDAAPALSDGESAVAPEVSEAATAEQDPPPITMEEVAAELLVTDEAAPQLETDESRLLAMLEAVIYVTDEPLGAAQMATALGQPQDRIEALLDRLIASYDTPERGISIRQVAGGYKMGTKPEHHEEVRNFVKNLKPPLKLSLAALETLAVIAYKQPITAPEIMEIRGVQGAGVLKTLVDRKLITTAGRKAVVGKPILYKTTKDFLVQFGLKDLNELPTLKEFEELRRMAFDGDTPEPVEGSPAPGSEPTSAPAEQPPPPAPDDLAAETPGAPNVEEHAAHQDSPKIEPPAEHQETGRPE